MTFKIIRTICLATAASMPLAPALADPATYPTRPIELIVPYAPGGASDVIARSLAPYLQEELGATVVVSNRSGANTAIAATYLARAPNDGYTLMLADVALLLNAAIRPKSLSYDPEKDYAPVSLLGSAPFVLYVPASGSPDLAEFLAKGSKKGLTIANSGPGSLGHLAAELLQLKSHSAIVSIPYRGAGPAMNDTVGGQVDAIFGSTPSGMPLVKNGQLRALAVASPQRAEDFPALPTFDELGIADVHVLNWWGVIAPAGTDAAIVDRIYQALQKVVALPSVRERFKTLGITPSMRSPTEFASVMKADLTLWSGVVKEAKIKVE